jgi:DNA-binding CsgD family transcriptional regulator
VELWDDDAWHRLATRAVGVVRESGALTVLPIALGYRAGAHIHAGELDAARGLLDEADAIATATGKPPLPYVSIVLAAWRGADERASEKIASRAREAIALGDGRALFLAEYATAVLHNGLGGYETAFAAAERASAYDDLGLLGWALAEQVEAGVRSDRPGAASAAMARLAERTSARGTDWALGIEARSRALLSDPGAAEDLYREAIGRLGRTRIAVHLARAHLLYGEWLRRAGRRVDAREQLRTAHGMFGRFGTQAFAERARRELLATGETVRKRSVAALDELTAQEAQIARLAGDGRTNPEIGAELFISPRTVEWHLRNVFSKLGIGSRRELHRALAERP